MKAAPPGRRASTKPVGKFRGAELVSRVKHNPHNRTDEEQAAFELANPEEAAREWEIFEKELAEEERREQESLQNAERERIIQQEKVTEAKKLADAKEQQIAEAEEMARKQTEINNAKRAEAARVEEARKEKEADAARRAEAERIVDARIAAEKAQAEASARAEAEAEEERKAQLALQERIAAEKARRERLRKEEAELAAATAEAERIAAQNEAAAKAEAARAALAAANEEDTEELREKRRLAEEKRRKREAFLMDLDGFSNDFEAHNAAIAKQNKDQLAQTDTIIASTLANQAQNFKAVPSTYAPEKAAPVQLPSRPVVQHERAKPVVEEPKGPEEREGVVKLTVGSETFDKTTASLFSNMNISEKVSAAQTVTFNDDAPLSAPSRVGRGDGKKISGKAAPLVESSSIALKPTLPVAKIGDARTESAIPDLNKYDSKSEPSTRSIASAGQSPTKGAAIGDQYTEEEGFGNDDSISNVLTREEREQLTSAQKAHWMAKQEDLGKRRKGFHGAVTYAFDGIFSWQMYGSAEAVDESGSTYTEYLMRCQWGTSWDNLQPWIAARRYREFDQLDSELRSQFPNFERAMPKLPGKDFFRFLEADVIDKRRQTLENYVSRIVLHLPTILRSSTMGDFLGIQDRLITIKKLLAASKVPDPKSMFSGQSPDISPPQEKHAALAPTVVTSQPNSTSPQSVFAAGSEHISNGEITIKTADQADQRRRELGYGPLSDEELAEFEDNLRKLIIGLQNHNSGKRIKKTSAGYINLVKLTMQWPQLRATCLVENASNMSFTLIPRAMQAEEDLIRLIRDFENLTATADHLAVLGI